MAAKGRFLIDSRVFVLFLILGIPPLIVGHLILVGGTASRFSDTIGKYLHSRADHLQYQLIGYIEKMSIESANLGGVPVIRAAVQEANGRIPDPDKFHESVQAVETEWPSMSVGNSQLLTRILENDASKFLREYNRIVASFREIMVTDRYGRLVAASSKTSDYYQADENWWRVAYLEGTGQRYISDIVYDESARVYCIEIAEPIRDPTSREVLGILKTIVDSDTLFGMLDSSRYRENTVAVLLREDGSIVSDPGSVETYPFIEQIRAERGLNRSFLVAPSEKPEVVLGLPSLSVKDRLPELDWTLVIQAPYEDVFFPIRDLKRWFLYIVIFSVSLVIILSLIFTWVLSKPIVEIDPHLDRV